MEGTFSIRDLTDEIRVQLNLQIFFRSRMQFEANETFINQKIASNRIHVERFINNVKKFRLLDRTIPLSLHGSINQVWTVAVLLTLSHFPNYFCLKGHYHAIWKLNNDLVLLFNAI